MSPFEVNNDGSPRPIRPASNRKLEQKSVERLTPGRKDEDAGDFLKLNPYEARVDELESSTGFVQVAQLAVDTVSDNLRQMRELALAASRDDLTASQRASIQAKLQTLVRSLNHMASEASFNGRPLLDGSAEVSVGAAVPLVSLPRADAASLFPAGEPAASTTEDSQRSVRGIDEAMTQVGATAERLVAARQAIEQRLDVERANSMSATSGIPHIVDFSKAREAAVFARQGIVTESTTAVMAQANLRSQFVLQLFGGS